MPSGIACVWSMHSALIVSAETRSCISGHAACRQRAGMDCRTARMRVAMARRGERPRLGRWIRDLDSIDRSCSVCFVS
jgi:hypothetical protein